jgi:hypothetical protein
MNRIVSMSILRVLAAAWFAATVLVLPPMARATEVTGTWSTVSSVPYPNGPTLLAMDALSASDIWAVGMSAAGFAHTQRWNGSSWATVATPNLAGATGTTPLRAVAAISATDAWAVGDDNSGTGIALHWNGSTWTQAALPAVPGYVSLTGVSAVSSSEVWAVGYVATDSFRTLTLRWNGSAWTQVPSPNPSTASIPANFLYGIHARSSTEVWAVGTYHPKSTRKSSLSPQTLALRWNGSAWQHVATPALKDANGFSVYSRFSAVRSISANDAWAVGTVGNQTLAMHWNGSAWAVTPTPNVPYQEGAFNSVDAAASGDVWAVGVARRPVRIGSENPGTEDSSLIAHWNGSTWTLVPSPNPIPTSTDLRGATVVNARDVWAAGRFGFTARYVAP